jgi:peptide/nickel transport system substrate-binding protein
LLVLSVPGLLAALTLAVVAWSATRGTDQVAVYREAVVGEMPRVDPHTLELAPRDPDLSWLLFRGLVRVDRHGSVEPDLAERWELGTDDRVFRFYLRPDLSWDDGEPITTDDVLFSARRAAEAARQAGQPSVWSSAIVKVAGPGVVEIILPELLGAFLEEAALPIVAAHAPPSPTAPMAASGPYRLVRRDGSGLVLERNHRYDGPAPAFERLEFVLESGPEAALQALLDGRVDGLARLTPAERQILELTGAPVEVYRPAELDKHSLLVLNTRYGIFSERAVRQAVGLAIDRQVLIEAVLAGDGVAAGGPFSPLSWAYDGGVTTASFDPAAARGHLERAGWLAPPSGGPRRRDGIELRFGLLTSDGDLRRHEAAELARQLREVGFGVDVETTSLEAMIGDRLRLGRFDAAVLGRWLANLDPDQFALWHSSQAWGLGENFSAISSPELDRWLELGRRRMGQPERREAMLHVQEVWAEEQPAVLLYHPLAAFALSRDIRGVSGAPLPDVSWRLRGLPGWSRTPADGWLERWWPFRGWSFGR